MVRSRVFAGFIACLAAACGPSDVVVEVRIPDQLGEETPLAGTRLVFLPYDRDSILTALANRAPSPRPDTGTLDSLMALFREPFNHYLRLSAAHQAATDSAAARALGDSLARARLALDQTRARLDSALEHERARLRSWQDTAFRSFDSLAAAVAASRRREPVVDSTRANGATRVRLRAGDWWVVAYAVNLQDPNAEWYWNVKIDADTMRLGPRNGRARPRI